MSLSDVSDLTDISSDEEDVPLAKRNSKAKKASKEYKVTHVLRAPRTAQYTAKSLYDQIIDNSIDLDPEYQRDVVWQEEKQSGLIDSILRNYYIPPIIFAVTIQDDGSEMRTCIDGKQRLTSIQRFIDGQIPHKDSFTNEKLWFKSSAGIARRKLLPQHLRTLFANKQIVCIEYTGLDDDQEREIFQRVQLGVALTPAERLQALVGPWATLIHEIQHQVLGEEGFEGYLDWGHTRGRDFQCLATMGYLIESHPKTSVPGPKTLEKWLQKTQPISNQLRADLHETFRIFVTLARDKKYSGSLNQPTRVSPIEFVFIGLLIYLKRQTLSLTQISSAIEKMRKDVRASHQDIRSNARVTKHLVDFMKKKIKVSELRCDGEGDKPAALAVAKPTKPVKRKRPVQSDDSDDEPISKVKLAKLPPNPRVTEAVKSSKETSSKSTSKTNSVKKASSTSSQTRGPAKPLQSSTTSRLTNNSLSSVSSVPSQRPPSPTPIIQASHGRPPPTAPSASKNQVYSGPAGPNPTLDAPPNVQTGSIVKKESPQIPSLNSPTPLSMADRLAPIRAAKASIAPSGGAQSPMSNDSDVREPVDPGASTLPVCTSLPQKPVAPPSQQPPPPVQLPPQYPPVRAPLPPEVEGVLRALRSQFPQLGTSGQSSTNDAANSAASGPNGQSAGMTSHPMMAPLMSGPGHIGSANNPGSTSQGYGGGTPQGTFNGATNLTSQQPATNFSTHTPASLQYALPPRPTVVTSVPSNSMRAEPFGAPPRSASSECSVTGGRRGSYHNEGRSIADGRRGSYHNDWRRSQDDRRSSTYDRNQDIDRNKRNWSYPRP